MFSWCERANNRLCNDPISGVTDFCIVERLPRMAVVLSSAAKKQPPVCKDIQRLFSRVDAPHYVMSGHSGGEGSTQDSVFAFVLLHEIG